MELLGLINRELAISTAGILAVSAVVALLPRGGISPFNRPGHRARSRLPEKSDPNIVHRARAATDGARPYLRRKAFQREDSRP